MYAAIGIGISLATVLEVMATSDVLPPTTISPEVPGLKSIDEKSESPEIPPISLG